MYTLVVSFFQVLAVQKVEKKTTHFKGNVLRNTKFQNHRCFTTGHQIVLSM